MVSSASRSYSDSIPHTSPRIRATRYILIELHLRGCPKFPIGVHGFWLVGPRCAGQMFERAIRILGIACYKPEGHKSESRMMVIECTPERWERFGSAPG